MCIRDRFTNEAIQFLRRHRDRPFFLYLPYTAPHSPYQGPGDETGKLVSRDAWNRGTRAKYVEMIEDMDAQIGRVLRELQAARLADNTVVIFASDNGGTKLARNAPFSGYKGTLFEGGIRVPLIIRWPGQIKPGTVCHQSAIMMDLTASILRIAGAKPPEGRPLDGIDIISHVQQGQPARPRTLFWRARRGQRTWWAVRDGSLKYIRLRDGQTTTQWLFDLARDPAERHNLLSQRPDDVRRLRRLLAECCLLYTSPSPRDLSTSRMPSSA